MVVDEITISQSKKTPFQALKTTSSKSKKIHIFPKGLTHGFCPKMAIFETFFFSFKGQENGFTIFQNEKTPFQAIKARSSRSRKIDIFSKRLTHGFCRKIAIFSFFFFYAIQARKISFTISQKEKMRFKAIKTRRSKSREFDIFPEGSTHGFRPNVTIF